MQAVIDRPPTSGSITDDAGGGDGWVTLYRAKGDIEAHLLSGRLEAAGVETSFLKDRRGAAWMHGGSDPAAPVDVMVRRLQLEDARLVLAEIAYEWPYEARSPATRTSWKTVVVWWGAALALGLAFTGIALARTSEQMRDCGLSWSCEAPARP